MDDFQLFVIVDDTRSDSFVFGPLPWTSTEALQWFNNTIQSPTFASQPESSLGTVQMKFEGTSVAFFGNTPKDRSQTFSVSIDGSPPYNTSYADPNPPSYRQWYQSPLLDAGTHNIALSRIVSDTSVDFAVVTVGDDTPLSDALVIADDNDSSFNYTGNWKPSQAEFNSGPNVDGNPYHNSTHQTGDVGSFFTFRFTGRSAAIYGIFTWFNLGFTTLTFTLDGQSLSRTYSVNSDTPQFISELGQQQNFLFYQYDFLETGDHTLVVNLTACSNQTFILDYVTFTPSYETLSQQPGFPAHNSTNAQESQIVKNTHFGIIAASVGAALIILLLCGIFVFMKRRRDKGGRYNPIHPFKSDWPRIRLMPITSPRASQTDDRTMDLPMQSINSVDNRHRSLYQTEMETSEPLAPLRPVRPLPLPLSLQEGRPGEDTPSGSAHVITGSHASTALRSESTRFSEWGMESNTEDLPSYDETTRGQPPPPLTYVIQR